MNQLKTKTNIFMCMFKKAFRSSSLMSPKCFIILVKSKVNSDHQLFDSGF